jgi:hypothetical protein
MRRYYGASREALIESVKEDHRKAESKWWDCDTKENYIDHVERYYLAHPFGLRGKIRSLDDLSKFEQEHMIDHVLLTINFRRARGRNKKGVLQNQDIQSGRFVKLPKAEAQKERRRRIAELKAKRAARQS